MLSIKGELKDYLKTFDKEYILTIKTKTEEIPEEELKTLQEAKNGLKINISKWREHRSLNANAYAWVLMDKIAKKLNTTKEEIYREIIKKVGVFEPLPIKTQIVNVFKSRWESKGLGWVCDIQGDSKLPNYTNVFAYYGTSTYNTEEMSRFIDEIILEAKGLNIQTETPEQIAEMKSLWSEYEKQNKQT